MDLLVTHLDTYSRLGIPKLHHLVAFEAEDEVEEGKIRNTQLEKARCSSHTIQKCKKMAGQNTFEILLLNDANMIGEHQETRMKMPNMCPFEKRHFLTWIDLNSGFGRN